MTLPIVERLIVAARDANEMVRMIAKTAAAKGVDVQAITGHSDVERIGAFEHSPTILEAADTIEELEAALRQSRSWIGVRVSPVSSADVGKLCKQIDSLLAKIGGDA